MNNTKHRLLFIEDEEVDRMMIDRWASGSEGKAYTHKTASSFSEARKFLLSEKFDAVITDHELGDGKSFDVLKLVKDIPAIVMTRAGDEETAVEAMKKGASDYLTKDMNSGHLRLLPIRIENAIKQKKAEESLKKQAEIIESNYDDMMSMLNQMRIITAVTDEEGCITFISQTGIDKFELNPDMNGKRWDDILPLKPENRRELLRMIELEADKREKLQVRMETDSGKQYWMEIEVLDDPKNNLKKIFIIYDMTDLYDLRKQLHGKAKLHDMVGKSKVMNNLFQQIREVSQVNWTVLIEGETGTGKELVAQAIHNCGERRDKPFIAVNCAGLTESLLSSQLFGHKKGSFTGATGDQVGVFEAAHGGTLFLDEIGDVSMNVQTSLLRVLESKEITRIGESTPRKVDVRVLAATHKNISEDIKTGKFRADLMYRLRIARISIPALRHRREDIPVLSALFLSNCRAETGKEIKDISSEAMRKLIEYYWPGNVRELKSAIEFSVIHCAGPIIQMENLPPELIDERCAIQLNPEEEPDEKTRILAVLARFRGNKAKAARLLGMGRSTLYRRMEELEISSAG